MRNKSKIVRVPVPENFLALSSVITALETKSYYGSKRHEPILPRIINMRIIGIDPGYDRVGMAIIENEELLHSECFFTSSKDDFYTRLKEIGQRIAKIIEKYSPEVMAIESLFITKNQKTAMKVAEARGVISYEACLKEIPIYEYSPPQIKVAITGHGGSDKAQIIKMIPLLLKISTKMGNKKAQDDEYDAIAVALTCQACLR